MLGWLVLTLVFVDELASLVAAFVWGSRTSGVLVGVVAAVLVVAAWALFASPRARFGGPVVRPVVKVLVFGLASLGLWVVDLRVWALALLVFSVVVNAAAQLPSIRDLSTSTVGSRS